MRRKIRLGIDVRDLRLASTGTKTYLEEFIREASLLSSDVELIQLDSLWKPYWGNSKWGKALEHVNFFIWKQLTLPFKCHALRLDVVFCSDYYVPLIKGKAKKVVVFHDALFFDHPEYYNPLWLKLFKWIALPAARKVDAIIVPSHFSKERLVHFEPLFAEKIRVVPQGAKSFPNTTTVVSAASKLAIDKLKGRPYFLHVGVLEKRKNLAFLVEAFAAFRKKQDACLVLVGRPNPKIFNNSYEEVLRTVQENQLEDHVIFAGYLRDEDLPHWYTHARAYIFPSRYEGFGIPVLEAFHFETPVAVANNSCLLEIGGDAVMAFSPDDPAGLVRVMHTLFEDEEVRTDLIQKGKLRYSLYTWKAAAREILEICHSL